MHTQREKTKSRLIQVSMHEVGAYKKYISMRTVRPTFHYNTIFTTRNAIVRYKSSIYRTLLRFLGLPLLAPAELEVFLLRICAIRKKRRK